LQQAGAAVPSLAVYQAEWGSLREMADQGDFDEFIGNKAAYRR